MLSGHLLAMQFERNYQVTGIGSFTQAANLIAPFDKHVGRKGLVSQR